MIAKSNPSAGRQKELATLFRSARVIPVLTIERLDDAVPLVDAIAPSVKAVSGQGGDVLGNAIRQNVIDNVAKLNSATPILNAAVEARKLRVVGGIYRLKDGKVDMVA